MLHKRKFRKLNSADEKKSTVGKNPFQNQHDMSQNGLLIFLHTAAKCKA